MTTTSRTDADASAVDEAPPRPLRKDAARNRDALIAAGRAVFAERGLDASLDDVAHRAGVGVGTAYRNFANKYELARAIFDQRIDEMVAVAERAADTEPAWDGIVAMLESSAQMQSADRGLREILYGTHDADMFDSIADRLGPPTERLTARARAEGSVRPDVEMTDLWMVLTMLMTVADLTADAAPDLWRRYQAALLDGLRPGSTTPEVTAISSDAMRAVMRSHKQHLVHPDRAGRPSC
ncbi:TetR/AcrR family transcriptional regulator [Jatrophihabitans sp. YIM 134969]